MFILLYKKSQGPDKISNYLLKKITPYILKDIQQLEANFATFSIFESLWKQGYMWT